MELSPRFYVRSHALWTMQSLAWQDNEVRFDVSVSSLQMMAGEKVLKTFTPVEDTKANAGERGCLLMTNLRLIWHSLKSQKLNLTIGYNTLVVISSQPSDQPKKTAGETLCLLSKSSKGKFEFMFTPLNGGGNKLDIVSTLSDIHKSFVSSKPFRELRLRHHIIQSGQLKLVSSLEHICNRVEGVWNLTSNQGNLGCFVMTNVRLVWFASMNDYFNISLPYLQMTELCVRDSKFGEVLVVETAESSGGYVLGFRIDPASRLKEVFQEIKSLYATQIRNPQLGVVSSFENKCEANVDSERTEISDKDDGIQCLANYWVDEDHSANPPELDESLGLAMEKMADDVQRKTLWQIIW